MAACIKPGEKILIKPNLLGTNAPEEAVTTHPEVLRKVIRLVKQQGAIPVIGDNPALLNVEETYNKTGISRIAKEENTELIYFANYSVNEYQITHPALKKLHLSKYALEVDGIINLPKFKTHGLTLLTMGIKNLYGLVPGMTKVEYHKIAHTPRYFTDMLSELYKIVKPKLRLTIIDGIIGMDGEGPQEGRVRNFDLLMAAADTVALDTIGYELFGINSANVPLIIHCKNKNLGETKVSKIEIYDGDIKRFKIQNPLLSKTGFTSFIPEPLKDLIIRFFWVKPKIDRSKCKLCMKCVEICPMKTILKSGKILVIKWDKCISCFCCTEVCVHKAIETKESLIQTSARKTIHLIKKVFSKLSK